MPNNKWNSKPPPGSILDPLDQYAQNLVLCLLFNEGGGGKAYDLSGYGNHGTLTNMANPSTATSGWAAGGGCIYDGENDYLGMGNVLDFERTSSFSIGLWFKGAGSNTGDFLVSKQTTTAYEYRGYIIYVDDFDRICFMLRNESKTGNYIRVSTVATYTDTNRHRAVATYNGNSDASGVKIYVDGIKQTTTIIGNALSATISNSASFNIAGRNNAVGSNFNGLIDDVRIFNRALSADEARELYSNPWRMIWKPKSMITVPGGYMRLINEPHRLAGLIGR